MKTSIKTLTLCAAVLAAAIAVNAQVDDGAALGHGEDGKGRQLRDPFVGLASEGQPLRCLPGRCGEVAGRRRWLKACRAPTRVY